ncbi:trypsin-like cysteine/serine peptidase domain-containing protein [Mariannaea sp. PMI_226]|nr:trypsin-like cysteine/serine peptidase domain-containing protein [Mariannaea sp. PMI_226]
MSNVAAPIITEHLAGASAERIEYQDVISSLKAETVPGNLTTDSGNPDNAAVEEAKPHLVQAKNMQKLIEQGFPHAADVLQRNVVTNETAAPWRTIGKVFVGKDLNFNAPIWTGSGVLVGRNLLLTAGHVAPWGLNGWWMRFVPAFKNGAEPFGSSYVEAYRGYHQEGEVNGKDYVICKLYTPLGNTVGWMGSQSFGSDSSYYSGAWISVGYPSEPGTNPGANYMIVEQPVKIVDVDDEGNDGKELESNLYSLGGWSGGPLWANVGGQNRVIGVMSGDETDFLQPRHTVSAGGVAMVRLVQWGWSNWIV